MRPPEIETSGHGILRRVSPRIKLATALILITVTALLPRHPDVLYFGPASVLGLVWIVSRMPLGYTLSRMLIVEFFILGIALLSFLVPASQDSGPGCFD